MADDEKVWFDGETVYYSEDSERGMRFLRDDLDPEETRVYFDQARSKGKAPFEDKNGNNFTLIRRSDGHFEVTTR